MEKNTGSEHSNDAARYCRLDATGDGAACAIPFGWRGAAPGDARQAFVIVHGRRRDWVGSLDFAACAFLPHMPDLAIMAPHFPTASDLAAAEAADIARWTETGWIAGGHSVAPHGVTAFAVLDALLSHLADRTHFPALVDIVLAGHSAGGQLVHRYAVLAPHVDERIRFVVANPSSYVMFGDGTAAWKYGLAGRPDFGAAEDDATVEARYVARDVIYLLGANDCDPNHSALDRTRAALAQGPHRLARGSNYQAHLKTHHGTALRHRWVEIPDIGHDAAGLFAAPAARRALWS